MLSAMARSVGSSSGCQGRDEDGIYIGCLSVAGVKHHKQKQLKEVCFDLSP